MTLDELLAVRGLGVLPDCAEACVRAAEELQRMSTLVASRVAHVSEPAQPLNVHWLAADDLAV